MQKWLKKTEKTYFKNEYNLIIYSLIIIKKKFKITPTAS